MSLSCGHAFNIALTNKRSDGLKKPSDRLCLTLLVDHILNYSIVNTDNTLI